MWTNVFKIGGLQQISWFQFLPSESELNTVSEKSVKVEQKDVGTSLVLSAHLQLQKEGFLSTWTNSFVGPWDPSQGMHNPDEKIKLWLFLPGRNSSVLEIAQPTVSKLRVVGSGFWLAPGDSEEVAIALSQALRNCIERALRGISYMRYGDVFTRCHPFSQSGKQFRLAISLLYLHDARVKSFLSLDSLTVLRFDLSLFWSPTPFVPLSKPPHQIP
ncbi:hypothetical protein IFM89_011332 [Coptis chinensis]|uniref:Mediator of RNA polymerase II transcription subunit 13 n=1 Tax=Coptis chinensis TaxID=261450 RepID=A0A835IY72_9MAGN|nr:hypothetical protein IFM89_011332 [Coptis chinensis]